MNRKTILILSIIVFGIAIAINGYIYYDINHSGYDRMLSKNYAVVEEALKQNLSLENLIKAYKTHKTYKPLEGNFEFSNLDEFKKNLQNAQLKDIKNAHNFLKFVFNMEKDKYKATTYNSLYKSNSFIKTYKEYESYHLKNSELLEDMLKQLENKTQELEKQNELMPYLTTPNMELADSFFKKIRDSKTKQEEKELKQTKEKNAYEETINKARERMLVAKKKYERSKLDKDNKEYTEAYVKYMQISKDVDSLKSFENKIKNGQEEDLLYYNSMIKKDKKYNYLYQFFIENAVKIAIDKDYSTFLERLLKNNEINSDFKIDGIPILLYASEKNSKESIKILLDYAPLQEEVEDGQTLLHIAAAKGNYYLAQRILENSKDNINKETKEGKTPLYYAIRNNRYDIAALLIKSGANCDEKLKSETKIIPMQLTLATGEIPSEFQIRDDFNENIALTKEEEKWKEAYEYIKNGNVLQLFRLTEKGVDFTEMYIDGNSALDIAIHYNQFYIARLLINLYDFTKIVNLKNGMTALHHAVFHKNTNIFYLLLDNGFDLNSIDAQGNTPLHYAVNNSTLYTHLLLEKGANTNAINFKKANPLHLAVSGKKENIVYSLLNKNSTIINQQDSDGNTPLHLAAKYYDYNVFNKLCLYEKHFDCSIKNNENKTPHDITPKDYFENHDPVIKKAREEALIKAGKRPPQDNRWRCGTIEVNRRYHYCIDNYPYSFKSDSTEEQLIAELDKTFSRREDIKIMNEVHSNLLNLACENDYFNLLKKLLVYKKNIDYIPIFYKLCKNNSSKSFELFKDKEINYRYYNYSEGSILDFASEYGNIELAKSALEAGVPIDTGLYNNNRKSTFIKRSKYISPTKVENSGYKYDFLEEIKSGNKNTNKIKKLGINNPTPLKIAVYFNQYEMAEFLIKNGAKVDDKLKKDTKDIKMLNILRLSDKYKFKEINNE